VQDEKFNDCERIAIRSTLGLTAFDVISVVIIFFMGRTVSFATAFQMEHPQSSILN
jgi:hypothetical protein